MNYEKGDQITLGPGWNVEYLGPDESTEKSGPIIDRFFQPEDPSSTTVDIPGGRTAPPEHVTKQGNGSNSSVGAAPSSGLLLAGAVAITFVLWGMQ